MEGEDLDEGVKRRKAEKKAEEANRTELVPLVCIVLRGLNDSLFIVGTDSLSIGVCRLDSL